MDSMGAAPGTGPNTGAITVVRRAGELSTSGASPTARTLVMGILNLTPDSFSDGGRFTPEDGAAERAVETAVAAAHRMVAAGADIIDVGGESTRPGSEPTPADQERRRVLPVLQRLLAETPQTPHGPALISLDTRRASTARAGLELAQQHTQQHAGDPDGGPRLIINDVSGLLTDPQMPEVIAEFDAEVIIVHNRGDAQTMQSMTDYGDVVTEVLSELREITRRYLDVGVAAERIILDPGIGFAKDHQQNWQLIAELRRIVARGHRVLFGASRKGFLGELLADQSGAQRPVDQREDATVALTAAAAAAGVWAVRVHEVTPNADAVAVAHRLRATELSTAVQPAGG